MRRSALLPSLVLLLGSTVIVSVQAAGPAGAQSSGSRSAIGGAQALSRSWSAHPISGGRSPLGTAPDRLSSDFNGDGFDDLAVGVPYEDWPNGAGAVADAGVVNILYGSPSGLSAAGQLILMQTGTTGVLESGDHFGAALASGDFNGDGYHDLAVGVPGEDLTKSGSSVLDAGAVNVYLGSSTGLAPSSPAFVTQDFWPQGSAPYLSSPAEPGDEFGAALAVGDFDTNITPPGTTGMVFDDLAIGAPGEGVCEAPGAGAVNVVYSTNPTGLDFSPGAYVLPQYWYQGGTPYASGVAEAFDHFGQALAGADFDANGPDDLAVGVPGEDIDPSNSIVDAGAVNVIYGSFKGLTDLGNQVWTQDDLTNPTWNPSEKGDRFGAALAAGDFDETQVDGASADLAVGVPEEDLGPGNSIANAGAVNVIYGRQLPQPPPPGPGLGTAKNQFWTQASLGGTVGANERFGAALATGDFDGATSGQDGPWTDLAVGSPGDTAASGVVHVIYGSATAGLTPAGSQLMSQGLLACAPPPRSSPGDRFGFALAAGDFGKLFPSGSKPVADLVVGVPGESRFWTSPISVPGAGAINVVYGSSGPNPAGLVTTGNQFFSQGTNSCPNGTILGMREPSDQFGSALSA